MSTFSTPPDWGAALRHMAAGGSIAALMLFSPTPRATVVAQRPFLSGRDGHAMSTVPDGPADLEAAFWRTRYGLDRLLGEDSTTMPMITTGAASTTREEVLLATELRAVSGNLPIDMLARLVGVSRMRYHEWLRGAGINAENAARLSDLIAAFRTVTTARGTDLRAFLETPGPGGAPLTLLERGDIATVVGLALRPVAGPSGQDRVPVAARQISGISGWVRPTRRLTWESPHRTDDERAEARERLSPRALAEAPDVHDAEYGDAAAAVVAHAFFVE